MKHFIRFAFFLFVFNICEKPLRSQAAVSNDALFRKLQTDQTGEAFERFLELGKKQVDVREYLAVHLPKKIAAGPGQHLKAWQYEVNLAGLLQIVEAIPALAEHIDKKIPQDYVTLASKERLGDFPAGRSLAQIGEPAVPALSSALGSRDFQKRWVASRALTMIDATAATEALNNHASQESDPELKAYIERMVQNKRAGLPH